jgi:hypothetical protein
VHGAGQGGCRQGAGRSVWPPARPAPVSCAHARTRSGSAHQHALPAPARTRAPHPLPACLHPPCTPLQAEALLGVRGEGVAGLVFNRGKVRARKPPASCRAGKGGAAAWGHLAGPAARLASPGLSLAARPPAPAPKQRAHTMHTSSHNRCWAPLPLHSHTRTHTHSWHVARGRRWPPRGGWARRRARTRTRRRARTAATCRRTPRRWPRWRATRRGCWTRCGVRGAGCGGMAGARMHVGAAGPGGALRTQQGLASGVYAGVWGRVLAVGRVPGPPPWLCACMRQAVA